MPCCMAEHEGSLMADPGVRVKGVRELIRAADASGKETKKAVRDRLRQVGEGVRAGAQSRFQRYDLRSAAKFGVTVRRTGVVAVEQRLRRTTGQRPNFGRLQMTRALEPSLEAHEDDLEREMNDALDDIVAIFERRP